MAQNGNGVFNAIHSNFEAEYKKLLFILLAFLHYQLACRFKSCNKINCTLHLQHVIPQLDGNIRL